MTGSAIYLDAATAAPLHPAAREALMAAYADGWADPNRLYATARRARQLFDAAADVFATALRVRADSLTFFGSGTQAAHAAVLGTLAAAPAPARLVHSAIEHSAVLKAAQWHAMSQPDSASAIGVDVLGQLNLDQFHAAIQQPGTGLAAVMAANHEVGTVQPIADVAAACHAASVPLYVDAAAAVGWAPIPPGWSVLSASARKWGGPAGVGVLAIAPGVRWRSPWPTDESQNGRGVGALNLPLLVAAAAALRARLTDQEATSARLRPMIARLRDQLAEIPDVQVVGHPTERLPHIVTFSVLYVDGEALVHGLDRRGFAVSSGSACVASTLEPSHVLAAMGVITHGNVRVSLHDGVTDADVDAFFAALVDLIQELRG